MSVTDLTRARRWPGGGKGRRRRRSAAPPPLRATSRSPWRVCETASPTRRSAPPPTSSRQQDEALLGPGVPDHLQTDAASLRRLGSLFAGVAPVHVGQLHRLARGLLHRARQLLYLRAVLLVGRTEAQRQQVAQGVHRRVDLGALLAFGPVVAPARTALGGGAQRAYARGSPPWAPARGRRPAAAARAGRGPSPRRPRRADSGG